MYRIKIELDSFASDKFNQSLLSALDVVDSSERVAIPSAAGSGFVCRNKLEQGLGIVYWDLVLKSQLVAQHKVTAIDDPDNSYAIVYVLAGGDMNDAGTRVNAQEHTVSKKTILLYRQIQKSNLRYRPVNRLSFWVLPVAGNGLKMLLKEKGLASSSWTGC